MLFKTAVKRPVSTLMVLLMVIVLGIASIIGIPQALMPEIEYPVAIVMITYQGAGPEEIESLVTEPMEQQMASLEGLKNLMSITYEGVTIVMAEFEMGTDMNFATLDMREKVSLAQMFFPDGTGNPTIMKMNMNAIPVMQVYASADMTLNELNGMLEDNIIPQIERISGVASVSSTGGVDEEITINFEQDKLNGYGLTLSMISSMLAAENISLPSGNVTKGSSDIIVRTIGEFRSVEEIKNLPITLADRSIIRLEDIADIQLQMGEQTSISRIDGRQAIGVMISKTSDANIVGLSDDVQKTISQLNEQFPEVNLSVGFDQADFIRSSLNAVIEAALLGALLAIIIIFLFLRNVRSTMVIAISIPTSILCTFLLMSALGLTLNLLTLCSLAIAVGMVVDNSVVVLENIYRTNKLGLNPIEAAIKGSQEIFLPVLASTLTSIVVYLPIALSGGIAGMMFRDFSLTIVVALVASLIVSVTVVPMLCSKLLDSGISEDYISVGGHFYRYRLIPYFTKFIEWLTKTYEDFVTYALKHRKLITASCVAFFVASLVLIGIIGMEFLPATDEGTFSVTVEMPYGTTLEEKDALIGQMEEYTFNIPEVVSVTSSIGGTSMLGADSTSMTVTLNKKNEREKSTNDIVKEFRAAFSDVVGAEITVEASSTVGSMMGSADIQLNILGKNLDEVQRVADEISVMVRDVSGVFSAETSSEEGTEEVVVRLNRNTAAYYGVNAYQVANGLAEALSGNTATQYKVGGEEIDIILSLSDEYGESVENMKQIMITSSTGQRVPVGQIAEFEFGNSPSSIYRLNQQNYISIDVVTEGRDLGSITQDVLQITDSYQLPDGIYLETAGMQEEMMDAFGNLFLALIVSIALVYLILAAQFESIILPIMIMVSIPFAMSGAFIALFLTGQALSLTSFLGLIMLIGIVVNNSILLIEFINQKKEILTRDTAIIQAGILRMRPILMTTLTTCIGMVPLSMALGEGTEILAPMGISIIGGLLASTFVTLIIVPVLYAFVDDMEIKQKRKKERRRKIKAKREAEWLAKRA